MPLKALIFDVDGTLAETEECHREAFNKAFAEHGLNWNWSVEAYTDLLTITGGKERIARFAREIGCGKMIDVAALHAAKTNHYISMVETGAIKLRPGVEDVIKLAKAKDVRLAIATTTSRQNVDQLIASTLGVEAISWFEAICCGDEVRAKKPDPAIYRLALERLGLLAADCLAFEDSQAGLCSARGVGLRVIITPSIYTAHHDFSGADHVLEDLTRLADTRSFIFEK